MDAFLAVDGAAGLVIATLAYLALGLRDVAEHQRGVVLRLGRVQRVTGPGRTLILVGLDRLAVLDIRPFQLDVAVEGLEAQDGRRFDAAISAECHVLQPERAALEPGGYRAATRGVLDEVLRAAARELSAEELLSSRKRLGRGLKKVANERALGWGVDVMKVDVPQLAPQTEP